MSIELHTAVVLAVTEDDCTVRSPHGLSSIPFAAQFPTPRVERVSPGHLVAVATDADGRAVVVWRWYDAVILDGQDPDAIRLWEPAHGEVTAVGTDFYSARSRGTRAYASAGLRGAEWRVSGPVVEDPRDARVELDEVRALYEDNGMWPSAFGS